MQTIENVRRRPALIANFCSFDSRAICQKPTAGLRPARSTECGSTVSGQGGDLSNELTAETFMYCFEQMPLALSQYGRHWSLFNQFPEVQLRRGWRSGSGGFSVHSGSRSRVTQHDLPLIVNGPASRRLPLRILFFHSGAADVENCVHELRRAHFKVTANAVLTLEQLARQLKSNCYDVVLAQSPGANWAPAQLLAILRRGDRQIPCVFLTGTIQPETVAELITQGAADCVAMDHVGHLPVAIRRALSDNHLRGSAIKRKKSFATLKHATAPWSETLPMECASAPQKASSSMSIPRW
jgi:hypothetical protein